MHGRGDMQSATVPAFLTKLWTLVEDPSTDELICWSSSGTGFFVLDQARFAREILPLYFKHSNIASFIRQLNMYGFRKVTTIESGGLKLEKDEVEFAHPYFIRGKEHLLDKIKRKVTTQGKTEPESTIPVSRVLEDVQTMHSKQSSMNSKLETIKRENEALWREVATLRQKHNHQQQIVNKLIQFLVALVGPSRTKLGAKRKIPLMLTHEANKTKIPKMQRQLSYEYEHGTGGASITEVESPGYDKLLEENPLSSSDGMSSIMINEVMESPGAEDTGPFILSPEIDISAPFITLPDSEPAVSMGSSTRQVLSPSENQAVVVGNDGLIGLVPHDLVISSDGNLQPVNVLVQEGDTSTIGSTSSGSGRVIPSTDVLSPAGEGTSDDLIDNSPLSSSISSLVSVSNQKPTLQRLTSFQEMNDHVETVDTGLEALKDLLSGGQYNVDANTLLGLTPLMDFLDESPKFGTEEDSGLPDLPPSSSIVGNELIQYNPLDLNSLFDLGDIGATSGDDSMAADEDPFSSSVLNTPNIEDSLMSNPLDDVSIVSHKGGKVKRKGTPRKIKQEFD